MRRGKQLFRRLIDEHQLKITHMVEMFKTDITTSKEVESVETMISYHLGYTRVSCKGGRNKTLQVESAQINPPDVISLLSRMGYYCQPIH